MHSIWCDRPGRRELFALTVSQAHVTRFDQDPPLTDSDVVLPFLRNVCNEREVQGGEVVPCTQQEVVDLGRKKGRAQRLISSERTSSKCDRFQLQKYGYVWPNRR